MYIPSIDLHNSFVWLSMLPTIYNLTSLLCQVTGLFLFYFQNSWYNIIAAGIKDLFIHIKEVDLRKSPEDEVYLNSIHLGAKAV